MNKNVAVALVVVVIAVAGYFVYRTVVRRPEIPEEALGRKAPTLACGACGEVFHMTIGEAMKRGNPGVNGYKCPKCGEYEVRRTMTCPSCAETIAMPQYVDPEAPPPEPGTQLPPPPEYTCPKCGEVVALTGSAPVAPGGRAAPQPPTE